MSVRHSAALVPSPPGRADPLPVSVDSIMEMPVLQQLPGCTRLPRQLPFCGGSHSYVYLPRWLEFKPQSLCTKRKSGCGFGFLETTSDHLFLSMSIHKNAVSQENNRTRIHLIWNLLEVAAKDGYNLINATKILSFQQHLESCSKSLFNHNPCVMILSQFLKPIIDKWCDGGEALRLDEVSVSISAQ